MRPLTCIGAAVAAIALTACSSAAAPLSPAAGSSTSAAAKPSLAVPRRPRALDAPSGALNATAVIWQFFQNLHAQLAR